MKTHNGADLCDAFEVASPTGDQLEQPLTSDPFSAPVKQPATDFVPGAVKEKDAPQSHEAQQCVIIFGEPNTV